MTRNKHPDKNIEKALKHAEDHDWRVEKSDGHPWGQMYCPYNNASCSSSGEWCRMSIWSTPKNPKNHARQLEKRVNKCVKSQNRQKKEDSNE